MRRRRARGRWRKPVYWRLTCRAPRSRPMTWRVGSTLAICTTTSRRRTSAGLSRRSGSSTPSTCRSSPGTHRLGIEGCVDEVADELDWCCSASRSKGFCFLEYEDVLAAESAVQVLNGTPLANRTMRVRVAVGSGVAEMLVNSELSVLAAGWPTASRQH
jgi:hypothetical protein